MRIPRVVACIALALAAALADPAARACTSQGRWYDGFDEAALLRERGEAAARDGFVAKFASTPIDEVVAQLQAPDWPRRSAASIALSARGAAAVPALTTALTASHPWQRAGAAATLHRMGRGVRASAATETLAALVRDPAPFVRFHAVRALATVDPARAVEALVSSDGAGLADPDAIVRRSAIEELADIGADAVPALRKRLRSSLETSETHAVATADAIARIGPPAKSAIPDLVEVARADAPSVVRCAAVRALGALGDASVVPALVERLRDRSDGRLLTAAANALATLGPVAAPAARDVVEVFQLGSLKGEGEEFRDAHSALWRAIEALGAGAAPAFGDALVSSTWYTSTPARFLAALGDAGISQLIRGVRPPDGNPRDAAVEALEALGPKAAAAVPELVAALATDAPWDRLCAAKALTAIDATRTEVLPVLADALSNARPDSRAVETAAEAAGRLGPRGAPLVPALRAVVAGARATTQAERDVTAALVALVRIAPEARADVDALLADRKSPLRESAFQAMTKLGPPVAPWVATLLGDPLFDTTVRRTLIEWGAPSVEPVTRALDSPRPEVRRAAATTLAGLGAPARDALLAAAGREDTATREGLIAGIGSARADAIDVWLRLFPAPEARTSDVARAALSNACRAVEASLWDGGRPTVAQMVAVLAIEAPDEWVRPDWWGMWPRDGNRLVDAVRLRAAVFDAGHGASRPASERTVAPREEPAATRHQAISDLAAALDAPDRARRLVGAALLDTLVHPTRAMLRTAAQYSWIDPRRGLPRTADPALVEEVRQAAVPALRRLARGDDVEVARAAAATLAGLVPTAPEEARPLVDLALAQGAAESNGAGDERRERDVVLERVRYEAALEALSTVPAESLAPLADQLRTGTGPARSAALRALAGLDASPDGVVATLATIAAGADPEDGVHAARALVRRGADPVPLVPILADGLRGKGAVVRAALDGLARCGPLAASHAGTVVALLEERTTDAEVRVRLSDAIGALRAAGPAAAPFGPRIAVILRDRRDGSGRENDACDVPGVALLVRDAVCEPIDRIPLLLSWTPTDPAVADEIADVLAAEGPAVLVALAVALDRHDLPPGGSALLACTRLGPAAAPLLGRIATDTWQFDDLRVRALAAMGPDAWRILPEFEERASARFAEYGATASGDVYRSAVERIFGW